MVAQDKINHLIGKGAEASSYLKAYVETQFELKKIEASKTASRSLSSIVSAIVTTVMLTGVFLFLMAALSMYLSDQFGSYLYGFLSVAGIILLLFLVFMLLKKPLVNKAADKKINKAIFGDNIPEKHTEESLKQKVRELESYIEQTTKELPETVSSIQSKDFLPKILNFKEGSIGSNLNIKDRAVQLLITQGINFLRKKIMK